jgi:hypothetical protein
LKRESLFRLLDQGDDQKQSRRKSSVFLPAMLSLALAYPRRPEGR